MADTKISALPTDITTLETGDKFAVADVNDAGVNKFATIDEISTFVQGSVVPKSLFNANTVLAANSDDTPAAVTVGEQTVVGRITGGNITALSVAQLQALFASAALGAEITLGENYGIKFDAALSADGKYCGMVRAGTAGAALAFGDVVYLQTADSKWELAKADAEATCINKLGICVAAAAEDAATTILLVGKVRADAVFPSFTVGAPVFISEATAGDLTSTAPSTSTNIIRCVGQAASADELWFSPDGAWGTVA